MKARVITCGSKQILKTSANLDIFWGLVKQELSFSGVEETIMGEFLVILIPRLGISQVLCKEEIHMQTAYVKRV